MVGTFREVVEAPHLQELCEQPPPHLSLLHFLQDLPLQPFLCSDFLDFSFEQEDKENQTEQCQNAYMYSIIFQRNKVTN